VDHPFVAEQTVISIIAPGIIPICGMTEVRNMHPCRMVVHKGKKITN